MQQEMELFDGNVEKEFEFSFESKTKTQIGSKSFSRNVYIRRGQKGKVDRGFKVPNDKDYTFIHISGLNLLGKISNTLFRFITDNDSQPLNCDVLIPELNNLSKDELIDFVENVIRRSNNHEFEWDYEKRCSIYKQS